MGRGPYRPQHLAHAAGKIEVTREDGKGKALGSVFPFPALEVPTLQILDANFFYKNLLLSIFLLQEHTA